MKRRFGTVGFPPSELLSAEFENVIVLSDEFYQELISAPVPNDLDAVIVWRPRRPF